MTGAIPTNLITGFLGVGKTTAVRHLLAHRPEGQHWAVLVNEFGEIGVDGALLEQDAGDDVGVSITEVPGGCVCCVSSQAFTVGLNRLIRERRPDRILIEPTGLGHPAQIIATLTGPFYQGVLELRATVTLLDARHLASTRHRAHPTWQDQVHLADVLVASKADLYGEVEREAFASFAGELDPPKRKLATVAHGHLDPTWLDLPRHTHRASFPEAHAFLVAQQHAHEHDHDQTPAGDWVMVEGRGEDHVSVGWRIDPQRVFDVERLKAWLDGMQVDRAKGVLRTDVGWLVVNRNPDGGTWQPAAPRADSRLELIHHEVLDAAHLDREFRRSCT